VTRSEKRYPYHPYASALPLMCGAEYFNLVESVRERGLLHPIVLFDGQILDGRNRDRACSDADVEPVYVQYEGDDPIGYVWTINADRRHWNETQRALAATRLASLRPGRPSKKSPRRGELTQAELAEKFDVGIATIGNVRAALKTGIPELAEAMQSGELAASRAVEIAALSREAQKEALADVKNQPRKKTTAEQRDRMMTREVRLVESDLVALRTLHDLGAESDDPRAELGAKVLRRIMPAVQS
jgi:hypothetical protein